MQVTRRRVSGRARPRRSRQIQVVLASTTAFAVAGAGMAYATTAVFGRNVFGQNTVGTQYAEGLQVSDNQLLEPLGNRLLTEYGKFMGSTVSPDGRFLAATSTDKNVVLQVFDLSSDELVWTVGSAATVDQRLADSSVGQAGPTFSPDGRFLWLPQKDQLTRFPVDARGKLGRAASFALPKLGETSALPAKSVYSEDGSTLYVPLNGQNRVLAVDPATGVVRQSWAVGTAPREIAVVGDRLFVSNEGGRPAEPGEDTLNSYGTAVPADTFLGTSTTGTVSVIDTAAPAPDTGNGTSPTATTVTAVGTSTTPDTSAGTTARGAAVRSIDVGLHPTTLYTAGGALFVANTNSDTVSVIDPASETVVQTISTQPWPSSDVGYHPNGIALTEDGRLLVTLGRANAVAVYRYGGTPQEPVGFLGLLPTDYYPTDIALVDDEVVVTNTRGIDARGAELTFDKGFGTVPVTGLGTHSTTASLTRFALPNDVEVRKATTSVFRQNGWGNNDVKLAQGKRASAVPVPRRLGDPSTIQHVFLLVKENRTYDQVLGDDPRGNGDPALAQFGELATPNQHALARQFGLFDNTYDAGTNSAEGHNWLMQGDDPEYTETGAGAYERSYDTEDDVLGHQRSGFLWTAVESAGRSARNFGEFMQFEAKPPGATWRKYYCAATSGDPAALTDPSVKQDTQSPIPSLNAISDHDYPKYDLDIPDVYRYGIWQQDFEKNGPSNLNMFWLSSDHTGGPPDPRAQVADNDLAVGQIVDEISHSEYWASSAIFVVEDDSQNGADHVDGHRSPVQVISPWAQRGVVNSTYYSQLNLVRTIEQILGARPLNQKLAAATPMYDAFTSTPDLTPYVALPNRIPLTEGLATPPDCGLDTLGETGAAATAVTARAVRAVGVPLAQRALAAQWARWAAVQRATGSTTKPDIANPEQNNRYTWYQTHQWSVPYPGDVAVLAPEQVPGAYIPSADTE